MNKLVTSSDLIEEHFEEVRAFERRGDEITVDLLRRLDASFVTPFDREDIHALAEELDDVVDDMFAAASLLQLVRRRANARRSSRELAEVLVTMTEEMVALLDCLQTKKGARYRLERIEHLERQGDAIFQRGLARLFSGEYEALEVIKLEGHRPVARERHQRDRGRVGRRRVDPRQGVLSRGSADDRVGDE